MGEQPIHTFRKAERLNSRILIEKLFSGGSKSFSAFPLRVVYTFSDANIPANVSVLISVQKKRFKRAVKRNRVKRQIRESYRTNKQILFDATTASKQKLLIAFIWLDNRLYPTSTVEEKVKKLLQLIAERIV